MKERIFLTLLIIGSPIALVAIVLAIGPAENDTTPYGYCKRNCQGGLHSSRLEEFCMKMCLDAEYAKDSPDA